MNIPGPRPQAEGIDRGEYEPLTVYLIGDIVTSDGVRWRCVADARAGYLPPEIIDKDCPGVFWERVQTDPCGP